MTMTAALAETLVMTAKAAEAATAGWWIIGSAAVVLHGGKVPHVKDVDLMMSAADAGTFLRRVGAELRPADASERFHSKVFGIWDAPPVPVEVFGGFRVAHGASWREIRLQTREPVTVAGAEVYVPSASELVQLLLAFGRTKDLERAQMLRA